MVTSSAPGAVAGSERTVRFAQRPRCRLLRQRLRGRLRERPRPGLRLGGQLPRSLGGHGPGDGVFSTPYDVAVDASGNVFVADTTNERIQVFDSAGNFIRKWGSRGVGEVSSTSRGNRRGRLGNVFVIDYENDNLQVFDSAGNFIRRWGATGPAKGGSMVRAESRSILPVASSSPTRQQPRPGLQVRRHVHPFMGRNGLRRHGPRPARWSYRGPRR